MWIIGLTPRLHIIIVNKYQINNHLPQLNNFITRFHSCLSRVGRHHIYFPSPWLRRWRAWFHERKSTSLIGHPRTTNATQKREKFKLKIHTKKRTPFMSPFSFLFKKVSKWWVVGEFVVLTHDSRLTHCPSTLLLVIYSTHQFNYTHHSMWTISQLTLTTKNRSTVIRSVTRFK